MKDTIISAKKIIIVPILFVLIALFKIGINYYNSGEMMRDFVQRQAQVLNQFMIVHRDYYQNLYLNKTIPLDEKTLLGLPAFSAFEISNQFSQTNNFDIKVQTVSDRARNIKNSANPSELKAIEFFKTKKDEKEYFKDEGEYFQYATPLFIEKKCLKCHGPKNDAPKFISERYDTSYDYIVGELRGIVSIKVPKETISPYFRATFIRDAIFDLIVGLSILGISLYLIKYFRELASNLKEQVDSKTAELSKNIAYLKSYQLALNESSIVSRSDLFGNITYVNDNFCNISGYTRDEIIGKPHNFLRHSETPKDTFKEMWETIKAKKVWKGVLQNRGKNNEYWVDISILPIVDENNEVVEYIAVRHDITQMIQQQQKLNVAANTDMLTGLGSRYKLNNDVKNSINPAFAILDVDNFSQINDFYGHKNGDFVIKTLAKNILETFKKEFFEIYHLQGDEFVVFNKDIDKEEFIEIITQGASIISSKPIVMDGDELFINLTIAISFENKSKIHISADMALKVAKKENKSIVVYDEYISLNEEYENNIKWAKKIREAIETDRFIPVFQPIVNNHNGKREKYEALVRLKDDNGLVSPFFFLDISKKTKYYTSITKIMLNKSFEFLKDKDIEVSINLTVEDILDLDTINHIYSLLESYNIGKRVVFEIVESESIESFEKVALFIEKIKNFGCKIAIDDFGTGYSNFEYLMRLKADYIKIDGSMIKNIDTNQEAQFVVSTIVEFAKKIGMKTIAEFVENETIQAKVVELGIDYSQGYYFSKPLEEAEFLRKINT